MNKQTIAVGLVALVLGLAAGILGTSSWMGTAEPGHERRLAKTIGIARKIEIVCCRSGRTISISRAMLIVSARHRSWPCWKLSGTISPPGKSTLEVCSTAPGA